MLPLYLEERGIESKKTRDGIAYLGWMLKEVDDYKHDWQIEEEKRLKEVDANLTNIFR
jgi:hypothetical protein